MGDEFSWSSSSILLPFTGGTGRDGQEGGPVDSLGVPTLIFGRGLGALTEPVPGAEK